MRIIVNIHISFNSTVVGCTGPQTQQKRFVRVNSKSFNQHGAANVLCMFCVREQRWIILNRGNESSLKFICHLCIKHSATPRAAKAPHRPLTCGGSATASTAECGLRRTGWQPLAACGSWSPANDLVRRCSFRMEELAAYVTCFSTRTNTTDLDCLVMQLRQLHCRASKLQAAQLNRWNWMDLVARMLHLDDLSPRKRNETQTNINKSNNYKMIRVACQKYLIIPQTQQARYIFE